MVKDIYLTAGLIEGHVHIESTMLTPPKFALAVIPHGTTTVIADPHEIVNVMGLSGLEYMLAASENLPIDIYYMLLSYVPATHLETSGAIITANEMRECIRSSAHSRDRRNDEFSRSHWL